MRGRLSEKRRRSSAAIYEPSDIAAFSANDSGLPMATDLHPPQRLCSPEKVHSSARLLCRPAGLPVGATALVAGLQMEMAESATSPNTPDGGRTLTPLGLTFSVSE